MAASDLVGLWCPQCRAEYRPGFSVCSDCGVALVPEASLPARRREPEADHAQVEYDLDGWTDEQRSVLELLLAGAEVPHGWEGSHLVAPRVSEAQIDAFVDDLEAETGPPEAPSQSGTELEPMAEDAEPGGSTLAPPGRRFLGFLVDWIALTALAGGLSAMLQLHRDSPAGPRALVALLAALYWVVPVGLWGITLGKFVSGTRVVDAATGAVPHWWQAIVRWAVPASGGLIVLAFGAGTAHPGVSGLVGLAFWIVVYGGILWDPSRQGLHDRAGRTVVIRRAGEQARQPS